jgi:16S rRNA (cytosine967-C5)-methyltransferase
LSTEDTALEATLAPLLAALPATLAPLLAALPATLAPLLATLLALLAALLAALPALLAERGITGRDAAFATELTYGTCRCRGLLDAVIAAASGRPVDQIDPVLLDLLRLGAYQLLRTNVAQHAAVSTTVEQAGIEFDTARAGFVNGVLRSIARRDESSWVAELAPAAATDPVGHAAFVHAHPRWIAQAFADALGSDAGELDAALAADTTGTVEFVA